MTKCRSRGVLGARAVTAVLAAVLAVSFAATAAKGATQANERASGTVAPPPGSGINTKAALDNPQCASDAGAYGRMAFVYKGNASSSGGSGGVCVPVWKSGADNGGATAPGVTKDAVKLVVVTPNQTQLNSGLGTGVPTNLATGKPGLMSDAIIDTLAAYEHVYQTWGRTIDVSFVPSSGSDEAAQRADALKVKALKPFAVIDGTVTGLDVLEGVLAQEKIMVQGYGTSTEEAVKQAPYRWGQYDSQAATYNVGEFMGKQLVGKKAEWAGDTATKGKARVFASIYPTGQMDITAFDKTLAQYKGKSVEDFEYTGNGTPIGDAAKAQEEAPPIVQKLKSLGVTSVVLFTDIGMTGALTHAATSQDYHPEWIITGTQYQDVVFLARSNYDQDQWSHAFGIAATTPAVVDGTTTVYPVPWYWGPNRGTYQVVEDQWLRWLMNGIQSAGPKLTPKTFQQGMFATPGEGGASTDDPTSAQVAYGKTAGLPYDEYMSTGTDFAVVWYDAETTDVSNVVGTIAPAKGVEWYLNGGQRSRGGDWPTKPFKFFDKSGAVVKFTTRPIPLVENPCVGCPSTGGPGTPSSRDT